MGRCRKKSGEIAVDRMYADNNELKVGDTVKSRKKTFRITGLVALSDYSALFQNNNDTMFDAVKFGVAIVTDKDFEALNQVKVQYNYAWIYDKKPATEKKRKEDGRRPDGRHGRCRDDRKFCTTIPESVDPFYRMIWEATVR